MTKESERATPAGVRADRQASSPGEGEGRMTAKLRYNATRRRFLRDSTLTTIGLMVAACAPGTTGPTPGGGGTAKKGGEFHGGWPYVLPPAGHFNGYAPNGILTTGIYRHLWLTTLGMYLWADKKFEYWLAESSGYKGDNYEG